MVVMRQIRPSRTCNRKVFAMRTTKKKLLGLLVGMLSFTGVVTATTAAPAAAATNIAGSVACVSTNNVVGIYVHANSSTSGWATMSVPGGTASAVSWTYSLNNGGTYWLDVGCGGTPQNWATNNYSDTYSGNSSGLICYDMTYEVPPALQFRCA